MSEKNRITITADCVCDLPDEYIEVSGVRLIHFYILTDNGCFRDRDEITSANIIEYLESGNTKAVTKPSSTEDYDRFFRKNLEDSDEIIHITIGSGASAAYESAVSAARQLGEQGKRVHVVDSKHLSTGMGHIIIKAVELRDKGCSTDEIVASLNEMKKHVSTTFITVNADYLYRNGRVSRTVKNICSAMNVHPVLTMKDGAIALKTVKIGNYRKACIRYIKSELRRAGKINRTRVFVTQVGCSLKEISEIKEQILKKCNFKEIIVTKASATVSCNCGKGTFGVLFVNDYQPQEG